MITCISRGIYCLESENCVEDLLQIIKLLYEYIVGSPCYVILKGFPFLGFSTIAQSFLYKKDSPFFGFPTIAQSFLYHCAIEIGFFFHQRGLFLSFGFSTIAQSFLYRKESPFMGFPLLRNHFSTIAQS